MDLIIDSRIHDRYPFLLDSQFSWLFDEHRRNLQIVTDTSIRNDTPTKIFQASVALNAVHVLCFDCLFEGVTDFASEYRAAGMLATGQRLYSLWQQGMEDFHPGDEFELVDAFARELKVEAWYHWQAAMSQTSAPAATTTPSRQPLGPDGGPTNHQLLQDSGRQMAATMYMLGALQRFEHMDPVTIRQVAGEIAVLGYSGLDYASSEQKYILRFLPDERFSGLQLMCLMYVGFKQVDPGIDTGVPLDDAYQEALKLYATGM